MSTREVIPCPGIAVWFTAIPSVREAVPELFEKLRAVQTMPELDALRGETVAAMEAADGVGGFIQIQNEFRKAKSRLERIPLKDRTW